MASMHLGCIAEDECIVLSRLGVLTGREQVAISAVSVFDGPFRQRSGACTPPGGREAHLIRCALPPSPLSEERHIPPWSSFQTLHDSRKLSVENLVAKLLEALQAVPTGFPHNFIGV